MRKYRPYSRYQLRLLRRHWIRRNLTAITLVTAGGLTIAVAVTILQLKIGGHGPITYYCLGAFDVAVVAAFLHLLHAAFLATDRQAMHHVRGAWGEENTRSELQRAKRKRLIWGWVDSISLKAGDLDHLVITRRGGLVAIDSKWRNTPDANDAAEMARSANRARLRAEGLAQTLLRTERGAHRARTRSVSVTPLVVVWGAAQHDLREDAAVEGVAFVRGRDLLQWLSRLDDGAVSRDAASDLLTRLTDFRASAWEVPGLS
ncbi:hypothetical protein [Nocardioides ungokensis]|uniref:hypothetical protein n=1 Tax=Nocardioides ungokensis TaxID=1643322 RepID=UPI0015DFE01F|nr:hypothetical protein [Nocardioides ungokensis]